MPMRLALAMWGHHANGHPVAGTSPARAALCTGVHATSAWMVLPTLRVPWRLHWVAAYGNGLVSRTRKWGGSALTGLAMGMVVARFCRDQPAVALARVFTSGPLKRVLG